MAPINGKDGSYDNDLARIKEVDWPGLNFSFISFFNPAIPFLSTFN